jgi:hypothetical protein
MIASGVKEILAGALVGTVTVVGSTFLAVAGAKDSETDTWTDNSRFAAVVVGGLMGLVSFSKGVYDIYQGLNSLNLMREDQQERRAGQDAGTVQHRDIISRLDRIEIIVEGLANELARMNAAQQI